MMQKTWTCRHADEHISLLYFNLKLNVRWYASFIYFYCFLIDDSKIAEVNLCSYKTRFKKKN